MVGKKGAFDFSMGSLAGWIIAVVVLALMIGIYITLKGKGGGAIDFLKNLWSFGR